MRFRNKRQLQEKFRAVFDNPAGREVLSFLCDKACVTSCTYVKGDHDETMMNEGARRLMLSVMQFLEKDVIEQVSDAIRD